MNKAVLGSYETDLSSLFEAWTRKGSKYKMLR